LQAIVINFTWYVVQGVAQEMDLATVPDSFGQDLANGRLKPRMMLALPAQRAAIAIERRHACQRGDLYGEG
jgi:hypothetical protein